MSNIAIKGATTGTGVFTLESPATNTDRTLILPDEAGTVLTSASNVAQKGVPAFRAYLGSNQTVSENTWTKLQMNTESFDTNSNYDISNFRFTPTVAGYYQASVSVRNLSSSAISYCFAGIHKNGISWQQGAAPSYLSNYAVGGCTTLVYLNGTSDYIEAYAFIQSGGTNTIETNSTQSTFSGVLVRAD